MVSRIKQRILLGYNSKVLGNIIQKVTSVTLQLENGNRAELVEHNILISRFLIATVIGKSIGNYILN